MKRIWETIFMVCLAGIVLLISPLPVSADLSLSAVSVTNVTPAEFSIVWRASEIATPMVSVYSDAAGTTDITSDVEVIIYPLISGDPGFVEEYYKEESKENLRSTTQSSGLMKAKVRGGSPDTQYFIRVGALGSGGQQVWSPADGSTLCVTTMVANDLINDGKMLLVTFTNDAMDLIADGWIAMASTDTSGETRFPVSAVIGDGAGPNQAFIDLSNLFGSDNLNWNPQAGSYDIKIELLGNGVTVDPQVFTIDMGDTFFDPDIQNITFNIDGPPDSDEDGLIDSLETRTEVCSKYLDADTDDDGLSDGEEDVNQNGIVDSGETDPCDPDSDGDGILDGTEAQKILPVPDPDEDGPAMGTDTSVFIADADPDTFTSPLEPDTDHDGLMDGIEDANLNGAVETDETDPSSPDTDGDSLLEW